MARVRYVRTAAGEKRYGVPIGSPIPIGRKVKHDAKKPSSSSGHSAPAKPPRKQRIVRSEAGAKRYGVPVGSPIPLGKTVKRTDSPDTPAGPASARTSLDAWDDATIARVAGMPADGQRDSGLGEIWREQGFNATPRVASGPEFDRASAGGMVLYRGITGGDAGKWADEYRTGRDPFPGLGTYGNGTYTAADRDEAAGYATGRGWRGSNTDGVVMRMALPANARTITQSDLRVLASQHNLTGDRGKAFGEPGRLASALGYDAIIMQPYGTGDPTKWAIVLNRGALIVDGKDTAP